MRRIISILAFSAVIATTAAAQVTALVDHVVVEYAAPVELDAAPLAAGHIVANSNDWSDVRMGDGATAGGVRIGTTILTNNQLEAWGGMRRTDIETLLALSIARNRIDLSPYALAADLLGYVPLANYSASTGSLWSAVADCATSATLATATNALALRIDDLSAATFGAITNEADPMWVAASTNYLTKSQLDTILALSLADQRQDLSAIHTAIADLGSATNEISASISELLEAFTAFSNRWTEGSVFPPVFQPPTQTNVLRWYAATNLGPRRWVDVQSSAAGDFAVATAQDSYIAQKMDGEWSDVVSAGSRTWVCSGASLDGSVAFALPEYGHPMIRRNGTWAKEPGGAAAAWNAGGINNNSYLFAGDNIFAMWNSALGYTNFSQAAEWTACTRASANESVIALTGCGSSPPCYWAGDQDGFSNNLFLGLTLQSGKVGHFCTAGGVLQHPYIGVPAESPSYLVGSGYGDAEINFEQPGQRNWTDAALDDAGTKFFACASNDAIYHCDNGAWTRHAHTNDWAQIECDRLGTRAIARCSGTNYIYYWDGSTWEPQVDLGQKKWRWVNMDRVADTFWAIADGYDWLYEGAMQ